MLADVGTGAHTDINAAGIALGSIISRTGNELALEILKQRFESSDASVVRAAQLGLTVSGDPEAFAILGDAALKAPTRLAATGLLLAAEENLRIAEIGLREHYLNPQKAVFPDNPTADEGEAFAIPLPEENEDQSAE